MTKTKIIYIQSCRKADIEDKTIYVYKQRHIYLSFVPNLTNHKYTKSNNRFIITYFIPIFSGIKIVLI